MKNYPPKRYIQQFADKDTLEFIDFLTSHPLIKLILAGHIHFDYESIFAGKIPQLITGIGSLREITLI